MTYEDIIHDEEVLALLEKGNANLGVLGFTDHSKSHCALVADRAAYILKTLGFSEKERSWRRSRASCTTSATPSTASTTPNGAA